MTLINNLAKYYKSCLYEEAKISAFSNLHKEDNEIIKLNGYEKILHNYPNPYIAQDESSSLTQVMLKNSINNKKQLLYGYMFITGTLEDGTKIYTPLIYADCILERINGKIVVSINEDTMTFNIPALVQLVSSDSERDMLIQQILSQDLTGTLPLTEDKVKSIENTLADIIPTLDVFGKKTNESGDEYRVHLNRENAVILTTINKGLAGVINDLDLITQVPKGITDKTCLKAASDDEIDVEISEALDGIYPSTFPYSDETNINLDRFLPAFILDSAQEQVARTAATDTITAITGGPGTGKSNTIAGIATNYLLNGKSVLICSKMSSAVDVVYNKLSSFSRIPYCVRTGGKEYRKNLAELLDKIVLNKYSLSSRDIDRKTQAVELMWSKYSINNDYKFTNEYYQEIKHELSKAINDWESEKNLIKKFFKGKKADKINKNSHMIYEDLSDLENQFTKEEDFVKLKKDTLISIARGNLAEVHENNILRRNLTVFSQALKKGELNKIDYYNIFEELVRKVLPCWCTTTVDVSNSIPPIAGLFDVVIIDEASQCDIASCIPLLYRAKRAVIVGDDKQLKYLSFLSNAVNNANIDLYNLGKYAYMCNYRENSMYDFANYFSNGNVILKYQYRGCPEIMNFSNEKFYNNILTNVGKSNLQPVSVTTVKGSVMSGKAVNNVEAKEIIESIKKIIADDKNKGKLVPTTIGVLSPFREQVKLIEKMITSVFTLEEIQKHEILVGTAHSFQGEERDVMLLSWTVADNSPIQSFTFINNPNLFNVSITRARYQVQNFISTSNLPKGLLKEYIEYCECINNKVDNVPAEVA